MDTETDLRERIALSVQAWMKHADFKTAQLAEQADISRQTVYDLLNKTRLVGPDVLAKIAVPLGTTPGALLDGVLPFSLKGSIGGVTPRGVGPGQLQSPEDAIDQLLTVAERVAAIDEALDTLVKDEWLPRTLRARVRAALGRGPKGRSL